MLLFKLLICLGMLEAVIGESRVTYVSTEHPVLKWYNPKYIRYANLTARRYGRSDLLYYVGFHVDILGPLSNNVNVDFYFYEYLSNQYKRSFVELHFLTCDLIAKDLFFGISFKKFFSSSCPLPAGVYHIDNVTVPLSYIPTNFPFTKGRVELNFTEKDTHELVMSGHMDMEIKEISTRRMRNRTRIEKAGGVALRGEDTE